MKIISQFLMKHNLYMDKFDIQLILRNHTLNKGTDISIDNFLKVLK
jgi:hypothetical protein